jgi:hypothetical protein
MPIILGRGEKDRLFQVTTEDEGGGILKQLVSEPTMKYYID